MKKRLFCPLLCLVMLLSFSPFAFAATEEDIAEEVYEASLHLLYTREFEAARESFLALGDFRDSAGLADFCLSYPDSEPVETYTSSYLESWYVSRPYEHGTIYQHAGLQGVFYVPEEVNDETHFVLYYCGGGAGEDYLYYPGVYGYFENYRPNAVIFFCNESGYGHMADKNERMYHELQHIAHDLGTVVHDLSTMGSSAGCYTALKAAAQYYTDYGVRVRNVGTLDTGMYWDDDGHNLTDDECEALREAGTVLYLFEEPNVGLEVPQLRRFVDHGIETWSIGCLHEQHSLISMYAYINGVFSFCAGDDITLPDDEYTFVKLNG